ncbi:hypothetical protein [Candidatus Enterococcus clewellii]|uniref:Uncharacterized protein n=1 Tax=Candidatus Enterococcus clewellii TaxID=1834193 RepID=A0A242K3Y3_9ENTE|nr:hypothetical protein [Enterococcus sp. 9E7_DIV0242]OTP13623.1 hypothetical protein A5888_003101 [Enterococcus sp. 9E7_DIV0242]
MKLNEIRESYGFNQRTFYNWMKDQQLIEKTDNGYIIGSNALEGMNTEDTAYFGPDGKPKTMVTVTSEIADDIVKMYVGSGLDRLYSTTKRKGGQSKAEPFLMEEIERTKIRVDILENQLGTLATQLNILANTMNT